MINEELFCRIYTDMVHKGMIFIAAPSVKQLGSEEQIGYVDLGTNGFYFRISHKNIIANRLTPSGAKDLFLRMVTKRSNVRKRIVVFKKEGTPYDIPLRHFLTPESYGLERHPAFKWRPYNGSPKDLKESQGKWLNSKGEEVIIENGGWNIGDPRKNLVTASLHYYYHHEGNENYPIYVMIYIRNTYIKN